MNPLLIKNYTAGGTVPDRRFVKFGSTAGEVVVATAASDAIIGVSRQPGGATAGQRIDVVRLGLADLDFGGTVTAGALVTSDAQGRAVAAAPAAGANVRACGPAELASVSGDVGAVLFTPAMMQG